MFMAKSQIETNLLANFWLKECLAILWTPNGDSEDRDY